MNTGMEIRPSFDDASALFREEQSFRQWWFWLTLVPALAMPVAIFVYAASDVAARQAEAGADSPSPNALIGVALLVFGLCAALFWLMYTVKLITVVRSDGLFVRFYPLHLRFHPISLTDTTSVRAVEYQPILDYGGWGIRFRGGGKAYNVSGDKGLRIDYQNGRHILIGTQQPELLEQAVLSIMR